MAFDSSTLIGTITNKVVEIKSSTETVVASDAATSISLWDIGGNLYMTQVNDNGSDDTATFLGKVITAANTTNLTIDKVTLAGASGYTYKINDENITGIVGSDLADKVILGKTNAASSGGSAPTFTNFAVGGDDLTLETGYSVILSTDATVAKNGQSTIRSGSQGKTNITLGASSKLTQASVGSVTSTEDVNLQLGTGDILKSTKIAGNVEITDKASSGEKLDLEITSGSVSYTSANAASDTDTISAVASGGKFFLASTGNTVADSIGTLSATNGGTIYLGTGDASNASLIAGEGTTISKATIKNSADLTASDADSKFVLKDATFNESANIDTGAMTKNAITLDIDSIASSKTVTDTISSAVDTTLDLTKSSGSFVAKSSTNGEGVVTLTSGAGVVMRAMRTNGAEGLNVSSNSKITDWVISDVSGKVNIKGTSEGDKVSIGIKTSDSNVIDFGGGSDTIALTAQAGTGSIAGGADDDIFDLSALGNSGTGTVVVTDLGYVSKRGVKEQSSLGADKVYFGSTISDNDLLGIKLDTTGNVASTIIKGVKFNLGAGESGTSKYIILGDGTSADEADWKIYEVNSTSAVYVGKYDASALDPSSISYATQDTETDINFDETDKTADSVDAAIDGSEGSKLSEKFTDMESAGTEKKFLNVVNGTNVDGTVKMGASPTNYLVMKKGATGTLTVDLGGSDAIVGLEDASADLSKMEINNWNSTKDVLVAADVDLTTYIDGTKSSKNLVAADTGLYGTDLVAKAGTFGATSKSGLWQTRFREADYDAKAGRIGSVNNEVLLAVGSSEAATADFSKATTPVVALVGDNNVKDAVIGSTGNDFIRGGNGDSIDGGKGNDVVYTTKSFVRIASADQGNDTIYGVKTGTDQDTFVMADGKTAKNFVLNSAFGTTGTATTKDLTVNDGSSTGSALLKTNATGDYVTTKIKDANGTYTTFIANTASGKTVTVETDTELQQTDYDLYVGVKNKDGLLDFGTLTKKNIFLGHSENAGEEFGDKSMYSNVNNVKSSTVGQSLLFGGSGKEVTLQAGGADDSLWGGGYGKADSLVGNASYRTNFGTTNGSGRDTVDAFSYGANAAEDGAITDVVYFVDGVNYINVNDKQLIVGSSAQDNLTFINRQKSNTKEINFSLGLGGQIFTALADLTENGSANMAFNTNDQLYLGQGSKSTVTFGDEEAVKFGFDSQYNGMNVGNLNAKGAAAYSMINGQANMDQSIVGSANGASSICGGFGDGFAGSGKDTLVGGGVGNTTFFVGKDMGNDVITNVTDGDTIVFLNTKVSDMAFSIDSDKNATAKIAGGATISVKANDNVKFSDTSKITAQFTDGTYVFNGATWEAKANA